MAESRRDAEVKAVARAWWAHDPIAFDSLDERFRELQMTRAEAAIAALDAARARSPQDEDLEAATTHQDALAAACGTEADGVPRPPQGKDHEEMSYAQRDAAARGIDLSEQGEDHEAGIRAAQTAIADRGERAEWRASEVARTAITAYLSHVSGGRDEA